MGVGLGDFRIPRVSPAAWLGSVKSALVSPAGRGSLGPIAASPVHHWELSALDCTPQALAVRWRVSLSLQGCEVEGFTVPAGTWLGKQLSGSVGKAQGCCSTQGVAVRGGERGHGVCTPEGVAHGELEPRGRPLEGAVARKPTQRASRAAGDECLSPPAFDLLLVSATGQTRPSQQGALVMGSTQVDRVGLRGVENGSTSQ